MRTLFKRTPAFFSGVVIGAVVSMVTLTASVALAGTGVGGIFNLGKTNSVNARTTLSGSTAGRQLQVSNSSTGAGGDRHRDQRRRRQVAALGQLLDQGGQVERRLPRRPARLCAAEPGERHLPERVGDQPGERERHRGLLAPGAGA